MSVISFRDLPLSHEVTHRMAAIYQSKLQNPEQGSALLSLLRSVAVDKSRGIYCAMSDSVEIPKKLPFRLIDKSSAGDDTAAYCYFLNPLLMPEKLGSAEFNIGSATKANLRRTNGGFLVVTIEQDCARPEQLDAIIRFTKPGDTITKLDDSLRIFKDYRGCTAVFSGNRSVHFHFVFDTRHLLNVPHDHVWMQRLADHPVQSAFMANVHNIYWDLVAKTFSEVASIEVEVDKELRNFSQWRRGPWGLRLVDSSENLLRLEIGQHVPQIVLFEKLRTVRAPKGSGSFAVDPSYALPLSPTSSRKLVSHVPSFFTDDVVQKLLPEFTERCRSEWGRDYPMPVSLGQDNGEWIFNFKNHEGDLNPSTVVRGNHSRLLIQGGVLDGTFILPGSLTAQETANDLALRFGLISESLKMPDDTGLVEPLTLQQKLKRGVPMKDQIESIAAKSMLIPVSTRPVDELKLLYRNNLNHALARVAGLDRDELVVSGEGIGKSSYIARQFANDALDTAMSFTDERQRFFCFAYRSVAQAQEKAADFSSPTRFAIVIQSFWKHYRAACAQCGVDPLQADKFDRPSDINSVLRTILHQKKDVYDTLESVRQNLWMRDGVLRFDAGKTFIFTSHQTVKTWTTSRLTKTWYHPEFRSLDDTQDNEALRREMLLQHVAYDDPEATDLLHVIPGALFDHLRSSEGSAWRNLSTVQKRSQYRSAVRKNILTDETFKTYDGLRHLNLAGFDQYAVDYEAMPFGHENSPESIYRGQHGERYFIRTQDWAFNSRVQWTFLTTEPLVAEMISAAYRKRNRTLMRFQLDNLPGVYPLRIPLSYDNRAKATSVTELAAEINERDPNAVVIADGLGKMKGARAMSFQAMKGLNSLAHNNIAVIVQHLAPEV
ncbi:hypothetical protein FNL56_00365 [Tardiphaga sp. vice304]|uniref:hypothetical protein n=1 Tax=Tardiphaga sp. vice304 TaxID=2592817 RepID=UPI001163E31F|nr:hypothetical protein [Tardiphaga sp. vice304]QDM24774.1 hypothetical protein FNL56_00365 [Tardiphaga sp. vice304]